MSKSLLPTDNAEYYKALKDQFDNKITELEKLYNSAVSDSVLINSVINNWAICKLEEEKEAWCTNCHDVQPTDELSLIYAEGQKTNGKQGIQLVQEVHELCGSCLDNGRSTPFYSKWRSWVERPNLFTVFNQNLINRGGVHMPFPAEARRMSDCNELPTKLLLKLDLPSRLGLRPFEVVRVGGLTGANRKKKMQLVAVK